MRSLFLLIALALSTACAGATVKTWHPRLFVVGADKAACEAELSRVRTAILTGKYATEWTFALSGRTDRANGTAERLKCLRALVDESYRATVIAEVKAAVAGTNYYPSQHETLLYLTMFDWFNSEWNTAEKLRMLQYFQEVVTRCQQTTRSIFNNHFWWDHHGFRRTAPGVALYGEGVDSTIEAWLWSRAQYWFYEQARQSYGTYAGDHGMSPEGCDYWTVGYTYMSPAAQVWSSGTDDNAFAESYGWSNWAKGAIYLWRPLDGRLTQWSDYRAFIGRIGETDNYNRLGQSQYFSFNCWLAYIRWGNSAEARWIYDNIVVIPDPITSQIVSSTYSDCYVHHIWNDAFGPQHNPTAISLATIPKSAYFSGYGAVVIRSGWTTSDVMFALKCNRLCAGHDHLDTGSFVIDRGSSLAIDSGYYSSNGDAYDQNTGEYYPRTIAHNCVTVYKPGQVVNVQWWAQTNEIANNDGGQRGAIPPAPNPGDRSPNTFEEAGAAEWSRGSVGRYQYDWSGGYTYAVADITNAYLSDSVSRYTRTVFSPDARYFFVLDRLTKTAADLPTRWLLHSVNQPQSVDGAVIGSLGSGSTAYTGREFYVQNGSSRLFVKMLAPTNNNATTLQFRGGTGYERWTTYDASGANATARRVPASTEEPGSWRIEELAASATSPYFLNILYASDTTVGSMGTATSIPCGIDTVACMAAGTVFVASIFETVDEIEMLEYVTYTIPAEGLFRHAIADVLPGTVYEVYKNDVKISELSSSTNSLIVFDDYSSVGDYYEVTSTGESGVDLPAPTGMRTKE
jgi:hypothetical protein